MAWFRWYEGTASDAKFRLIARKAGQPVAYVVAVWAMILERASEAGERGRISGFDCEAADAMLDMPEGAACAIVEAMQAKGMIDAERVCKWNERQPRRDDDSAERVREYRARKKAETDAQCNAEKRAVTQCNAVKRNVTQCNDSVTQCNAVKRAVTLDKSREDKNIKTHISPLDISENLDRARARMNAAGEKKSADATFAEEPSLDFVELRQFYSEHFRDEGKLAGFAEYRQARSSSGWPGYSRLYENLKASIDCNRWDKGFAPSLARYIRERMWQDTPKARASPSSGPTKAEVLAELEKVRAHDARMRALAAGGTA